ncbi:MAG: LamG domain-containing protein, partial [Coleofasciculaceae cyanobacterium]
MANVEIFLERTGLTRQELNELIFQDLSQQEINLGLSLLFFINSTDDGLGYLRIEQGPSDPENPTRPPQETLVNLSSAKLARIYRFLKLSRQLGWSFADLDWALRSLFQPYTPEVILQFDGINDYVRVSLSNSANQENNQLNLTNLQDTFTLEAWVYPTNNRLNPIFSQGREQDHSTHFLFWINETGKLAFYADALGNSNSEYPRSWQSLPTGQFSHVAVTVEPQELKFYINGQCDRTIPLSQAITPPNNPEEVNIGRNLNDCNFEGMIKEVRIWSGVRSALEISENRYLRLTGYENNLVAYWPLVEHPSRQLLDLTPNQNHGIIGGEEFVTQPRWTQGDLVLEPFPPAIGSQVYQFNGFDQYLAARGVTGLTSNQLTLEAWIRLEKNGANYIISKGNEDNQQTQFLLWVNNQGRLVFQSTSLENAREYSSQTSISLQEPIHVSVTVAEDAVRFYLNGILDREYALSSPPELDSQGDDLNIGRNFSGQYFNGHIYEVRLWNHARTVEQLNQYQHRFLPVDAPGLIGYWRLNQIEDGLAPDLSYNQNDLYLGGIPADYQPDQVEVEQLLPDLPIATTGTVLELDGDRDTIVLRHPDYIGLGHYEQITLELWFKPKELNLRTDHRQIIFTQGDEEAGLNIYLDQKRLYVIAWCAEYQGVNPQETVWVSEELASDQWHHLAVVNDESQSLDFIE